MRELAGFGCVVICCICSCDVCVSRIRFQSLAWNAYFIKFFFSDRVFFISCRPIYREGAGPGSSVGIATGYGLDSPGPNPGRGEIFRTRPDRPWDPPSLLYNGYRVFPEGKAAGAWC
jgi:hypothetical protein